MTAAVRDLLCTSLQTAVPLRIMELQARTDNPGWRNEVIRTWARQAAELVAHHGDMLMFRTPARKSHTKECLERKKSWEKCDCLTGTAEVFNALAKGIAAGSFTPGGINSFGVLFCANHYVMGVASNGNLPCAMCRIEEEVVTLGLDSLSKHLWKKLDEIMDRLKEDAQDALDKKKDEGRADNLAYVLALLEDPYDPNTRRVRATAVQRWKERHPLSPNRKFL